MNKNDFLDILRDYLKGTFSQLEINDILRDYEEFFLNGQLQGKSDEEIIRGLGSPKSIAQELTEEMKGQSPKAEKNSSEVFEKVNKEAKRAWKEAKVTGRKAGNKAKEFLDSNSVINGNISSAAIKMILAVMTITVIIFAMPVIFTIIGYLLTLVGMSIANFVGYIGAAVLLGVNLSMGIFGFFACITWTGFLILGWILYNLAYKGLKYLWVKYISWVRTRKMYIKVKEQQKNTTKNEQVKEDVVMEEVKKETKAEEIIYDEEIIIVEPILLEEAKDIKNQGENKEVTGYDE